MNANHKRGAAGPRRRRGFFWIPVVLSITGTVLIVLMTIGVNADILGRDLFNHPVAGVTEFLGLAIVAVVFLQLANTVREERHISNDIIVSGIALSYPRVKCAIYSVYYLLGAVLFALIVWFVIPIFIETYQGGYYKGTTGYIEIPVWPFQSTVIIGAAVTSVQYLLLAWRELKRAIGIDDA
jgi:TRAP-type C4-dicarboxylate transport system permease small subunit